MNAFHRDLHARRWRRIKKHWRTERALNGARRRSTLLPAAALGAALAIACGGGTPATPSPGALVTFAVGSETFRVALTTPDQVTAARAAQSGGPARIPLGRVIQGTQVNAGWSWHLEEVTFAEAAIELCDGRPSDVERAGIQFGGGRFCPWSATVVRID
jgi:hypothetical protein